MLLESHDCSARVRPRGRWKQRQRQTNRCRIRLSIVATPNVLRLITTLTIGAVIVGILH
jgi:hypothetical protein